MALPVTIPNTFANATSSIPLSQLDTNFGTLANAVNGLNSGSETLANLKATTANVGVLTVTGNATIGDASTDTVTLNSTLTANTAVIFAAGTSAAPSITTTGDPNTGIFFPAADTIAFTEGGAEAMRIDSSGNVGIGTSSPGAKLQVSRSGGSAGTGNLVYVDVTSSFGGVTLNSVSGQNCFVELYQAGTTKRGEFGIDSTNSLVNLGGFNGYGLALFTSGSERMRIDSSGNVGIGTSSPNALLDAYTTQGGSRIAATHGTSGSYPKASGISFGATSTSLSVSNNGGTTTFVGGAGIYANNSASSNNPTDLVFWTTSGGSSAERARITSGGNFYVGTSTDNSLSTVNPKAIFSGSGNNFVASISSLSNGNAVYFSAQNVSGATRQMDLGVYKHAGITNSAGYVGYVEEEATAQYTWVGNDGNFRISTNAADIGTNGGTVVGTQTSDERLKDIVGLVSYGLNEVLAIEPITFAFKDRPDSQKIGFSAQQVQSIVPEAVYDTGECIDGYDVDPENKMLQTPKSDRTKLAMEYTQLLPVLVNAVKELKAINDAQATRIETLEAQNAGFEARLAALESK